MIEWKVFEFNPFMENTYVVWDTATKDAIVIDPGNYTDYENDAIYNFIREQSILVRHILNTHCHLDHIFGNGFLKNKFGESELIIPEKEYTLYTKAVYQADIFGVEMNRPPEPDRFFVDGEKILVGQTSFIVLSTPGHTADGKSFYSESSGVCFSGDTIFRESIGRTDLPGGSFNVLISTIKEKLFVLPDKTIILTGHGEKSSIGHERVHNPFFKL